MSDKKKIRYCSCDEVVCRVGNNNFSPLLLFVSLTVWALRRISPYEILKWIFFRNRPTPSWVLDVYLLSLWTGTALIAFVFDKSLPVWTAYVFIFIIAQVVQTSVYHELLRPYRLSRQGVDLQISYSRLRNLVVGFGNFVYVTSLYGLIYLTAGATAFGEDSPFSSSLDAIYFGFTTAFTVGSVDIKPQLISSFVKLTIISQFIVTLFLGSIILSASTSGIRTTSDMPNTRKGEESPNSESTSRA